MKRIIQAVVSVSTLIFAQATANAETVTPSGSATFVGTVVIFSPTPGYLTCSASMTLDASPNHAGDTHGTYSHTDIPSGSLRVTSFTLSGPLCGIHIATGLPYNVNVTYSGTSYDLDIASFTIGSCSANIRATWNGSVINFANQWFGSCRLNGTLSPIPNNTFNITP